MAQTQILIDSSYLYALLDSSNRKHADALQVLTLYRAEMIVPYVVLTEVAFLFNRSGGVPAVIRFVETLIQLNPHFELLEQSDFERIREIMATYRDAKLDFVDCCIMAMSERLNITQVCTFDHRDFAIFRPKHAQHLEILP